MKHSKSTILGWVLVTCTWIGVGCFVAKPARAERPRYLFIQSLAGKESRQLVKDTDYVVQGSPNWSANGKKILTYSALNERDMWGCDTESPLLLATMMKKMNQPKLCTCDRCQKMDPLPCGCYPCDYCDCL